MPQTGIVSRFDKCRNFLGQLLVEELKTLDFFFIRKCSNSSRLHSQLVCWRWKLALTAKEERLEMENLHG